MESPEPDIDDGGTPPAPLPENVAGRTAAATIQSSSLPENVAGRTAAATMQSSSLPENLAVRSAAAPMQSSSLPAIGVGTSAAASSTAPAGNASHRSDAGGSSKAASRSEAGGESAHSSHRGKAPQAASLGRSKSTPGPGQYMWDDSVNLKRKPVWSMQSPERKHLDLMLPTWTPASTSLQPRAPDPGEYASPKPCGRRGVHNPPQFAWAKSSGRPCLAPEPPPQIELEYKIPSYIAGRNPTKKMTPMWSCFGKDRDMLPYDIPTWTPKEGFKMFYYAFNI